MVVLWNFNAQVSSACSGSAADSYGGALGGMVPANTMPKAANCWTSALRPRPFSVTPSLSAAQHTSSASTALVTRNISLTSSWWGNSSSTMCAVCSAARRQKLRQLHRQQSPPGVCHHLHTAQNAPPMCPKVGCSARRYPDTAHLFATGETAKLPSLQQLQQQPAATMWHTAVAAVTSAAREMHSTAVSRLTQSNVALHDL